MEIKILSGEKIQQACDHYIGSIDDINYNPLIKNEIINFPEKFINIENTFDFEFNNKSKIFCYTHILTLSFQKLINILNVMKNDFNIYFHNSDGNFFNCYYIELSKIPNLKKIYSQNNTVMSVITLPIGQANSQWTHGNYKLLENVINLKICKTENIYYNFNVGTNYSERIKCKNKLDNILPWINNLNYNDYLIKLSSYKFCICPVGNGLDTHRFWECIYLKVVPIVLKNEWTETIKNKFPMVILNDWCDLTKLKVQELNFELFKNFKLPEILNYI